MAQVTLRGNPLSTSGDIPVVGAAAPPFTLTRANLDDISLNDLAGTRVVLNINPSIDTKVCATTVRAFNERASSLDNTDVIAVSADLPFAYARFCGAEGLDHVIGASTFRSDFPDTYGVRMIDGPLAGLCARSVIVIDTDGTVLHSQLVPEIGEEPDYDAALAVL